MHMHSCMPTYLTVYMNWMTVGYAYKGQQKVNICILCHEALEQGVPTIIPNICAFLTPIVSATPNVSNLPPPVCHICVTRPNFHVSWPSNNPTMCKRQFCNMKKEFSKENVVQHLKLRWFPPNDLKPSKSKWRRSRRGPPSQWEAPIPTFTGNDPCVNTFGPRGNWLFLLAMFTCQRLVGACA